MEKKISFGIAIIIIIALLFTLTLAPQSSNPENTGFFTLSFAGESVQRSFSTPTTPDTNITITLSVELDGDTSIYGIEETFPSEFTLVDAGEGTSDGTNGIRWFDFEATPSSTINLTYTITSPSLEGTYVFSGESQLENDEASSTIGGMTNLEVNSTPAPACTNGEEKCESQTSFTCTNEIWVSQGLINGKCGYTTPSGETGGSGGSGGITNPPITPPTDTNTPDDIPTDDPVAPIGPVCGDNVCNTDETCKSCSLDCGKCFEPVNIQKIVEGDVEGTILDIDTISDYGQDYASYVYAFGALASFIILMGMFRLIRIRKGKSPSTIGWEKIKLGTK